MSETEHMHQTILDTAPIGPHVAPAVERVLEISDRVSHSQFGEGTVVTIVPNNFDPAMETYIGVQLANGNFVRVPQSQLKWLASNAEVLPIDPKYDAPKLVLDDEAEAFYEGQRDRAADAATAAHGPLIDDAPAPHGVVGGAERPPTPQPKRKPQAAPRKSPRAATEPQPRKKPITRRPAAGKNSSTPRSRPKHSNKGKK